MSEPLVLSPLEQFLDKIQGGRNLVEQASRVELSWLPDAYVTDLVVRAQPPDALVTELALLTDAAGATLAQLGPVRVALATPDDRPLLVRFTVGLSAGPAGLSATLELFDLTLAVELTQPWLRQVDPATGQPTGGSFRFEVGAMLRLGLDGSTSFQVYGFSIPAVEIGDTGLVLALDDCQLAAGGSGVPLSLSDLSGNPQFDGVYARSGELAWLPKFRFPGGGSPGFRLHFRDVLIDPGGFSFTLDERWDVQRVAGAPHQLSPRCAMLGRLFGDRLRIAFESFTGQVVLNQPADLLLSAWLEFPAFQALLHAEFEAVSDPQGAGSIRLTLTQDAGSTIRIALGSGSLTIENLSAEGSLKDEEFDLSGSCRFAIDLPGWQSGAIDLETSLSATKETISLAVALPQMGLGPLGQLSNAGFSVEFSHADDGSSQLTSFSIQATLAWHDLSARLGLNRLPSLIPQPPDDAQVTASISWQASGALTLEFEAEAGDPNSIFGFLPAAFRPDVRAVAFGFRAVYADANAFFSAQPNADIAGEAHAKISFRPRLAAALEDSGVVQLHTGDADGFVDAELSAQVDANAGTTLSLSVTSPLAVDLAIPGVTRGPLITAAWTKAGMSLAAGPRAPHETATVTCAGAFRINASAIEASPILAPQIVALLQPLMNLALRGTASATLQLQDDRAALTVQAQLADAQIEIDVFDLIGQLANGPGAGGRAASPAQQSATQQAGLDLDFRFGLNDLDLTIGALEQRQDQRVPVSAELHFTAGLSDVVLNAFARISDEELAIGIDGADVPLTVPEFPLTPADLDPLGGPQAWSAQRFAAALTAFQQQIDALSGQSGRRARQQQGSLVIRKAMLEFIGATWQSLSSNNTRRTYQDGVTAIVTMFAGVTGLMHGASTVRLVSEGAELRIPFRDPREIAAEGSASLAGFEAPLDGLNGLTLDLGLSPDQVYFGLTGTGKPVPLPAVGRYQNGFVNLSQLTIGYGFTRNSLALSFAGELKYPDHLTEDFDTSSRIGFGIKLPQYNRLGFRLDLIPVPGPIPVVPAFEFNIDLRTPGLPGIANTQVCQPVRDGFQLHIPGMIRADVKALAASPILGVIPAVNVRFDGDIDVGDDRFGLTFVCDDLLWLAGIGTPPNVLPVQFLIDPFAPYFEHLCVNVRCAGFGINFDVERPLPLPNPLLVFDVLALIADPLKPLDPKSPLARLMRLTVQDAYISIPPWARRLIPGGAQVVRNELNFEIDAGTLIAAAQWVARSLPPVIQAAQDAFAAGRQALEDLEAHPLRIDAGELLALLPPELRIVECELSFAGFAASASLVLITPDDAQSRTQAVNQLWQLPALAGFTRGDLTGLPALAASAAAALAVAEIELLNVASYRFFGRLADDGSFAMVTQARIDPLAISINGIKVVLPLQFRGRLTLVGEVTTRRRFAEVRAQASGQWDIVPGVLRVSAGVKKPVELRLNSTGRFSLAGDGAVDFFGGALHLAGTLEASESHLAVTGAIDFALGGTRRRPVLGLHASGSVTIGPGPNWAFTGAGDLRLYNLVLANASFRLTQRELAVRAAVHRQRWRIGALQFDTFLSGEFDGLVRFPRKGSPQLQIAGRGELDVGGAHLSGSVAVTADDQGLSVSAEGNLNWLGKPWFAARIAVSSAGAVDLFGRTSVVLDLTPSKDLLSGVQIASLFLRADFAAHLTLGPRFNLTQHAIDLDWSLGLRFPGAEGQTFVLAMQKVRIPSGPQINHKVITVPGMQFIPLDNLVIPIPRLDFGGSLQVITARLNFVGLDQVPFIMTDDIASAIQGVMGNDFVTHPENLVAIPKNLQLKFDDQRLGDLGADLGFSVRLQWKNNRLGFRVKKGTQSRFFGLEELL